MVWFPKHPYADSLPGFQIVARPKDGLAVPDVPRRWWSVRLALDESNDFDGLNRLGGTLWLDTQSRFGLRTTWTLLSERLDRGCGADALLGDANLTYRLIEHEMIQMHAGLGFRMLADPWDTHFGFNATLSADLFPVKPLVLSAIADVGTLGGAVAWHLRGTAGVVFRGCELYGGYDYLGVASALLQGPVVGVRFWF